MDKENNILKQIFFDDNNNWEKFKKANAKSIRGIVIKEIEKFRLCGEKESGFSLYACEMCGDIKIVPHRCKGRFCSVCATGYTQEWSKKTAKNMYNMPHRHIMFTLPEELWKIFLTHSVDSQIKVEKILTIKFRNLLELQINSQITTDKLYPIITLQ